MQKLEMRTLENATTINFDQNNSFTLKPEEIEK